MPPLLHLQYSLSSNKLYCAHAIDNISFILKLCLIQKVITNNK